MGGTRNPVRSYLISLPERILRSATALAAGLLQETSGVVIPAAFRRTRTYRSMVEAVLRFLLERVGEVEGVFPEEGRLAEDFLLRRTAGNGLELIGILTFRASPVWVLAALADLSGGGRHLISEISESLKKEGLIPPEAHPTTMNQVLDALESTAGRAAEAINTPPLDVAALRQEWAEIQTSFWSLPAPILPSTARLEAAWNDLRSTARTQGRSVFELSSMMALEAITSIPSRFAWLGKSTRIAAVRTTELLSGAVLDHYASTLDDIRREGVFQWWKKQFRPYLQAAAGQFSPRKQSWTERVLLKDR